MDIELGKVSGREVEISRNWGDTKEERILNLMKCIGVGFFSSCISFPLIIVGGNHIGVINSSEGRMEMPDLYIRNRVNHEITIDHNLLLMGLTTLALPLLITAKSINTHSKIEKVRMIAYAIFFGLFASTIATHFVPERGEKSLSWKHIEEKLAMSYLLMEIFSGVFGPMVLCGMIREERRNLKKKVTELDLPLNLLNK